MSNESTTSRRSVIRELCLWGRALCGRLWPLATRRSACLSASLQPGSRGAFCADHESHTRRSVRRGRIPSDASDDGARVCAWFESGDVAEVLFDALERQVRSGPPPGFFRIGWVRRFPRLNEFFVHHEDVRRANGRTPRSNVPDLDAALWRNVARAPWFLVRRQPFVRAAVHRPDSADGRHRRTGTRLPMFSALAYGSGRRRGRR